MLPQFDVVRRLTSAGLGLVSNTTALHCKVQTRDKVLTVVKSIQQTKQRGFQLRLYTKHLIKYKFTINFPPNKSLRHVLNSDTFKNI